MSEEIMIENPTYDDIISLVSAKFGSKIEFKQSTKKNVKAINDKKRIYMKADREIIQDLAYYLRDKLNFEQASSVTGVDWIDKLQVVYHITNYINAIMIEIEVDVPLEDPHIPSVAPVWGGADWHERETYELFGIIFDGHPKLERLLTPKSYEFYPFRKSYKLRGQE